MKTLANHKILFDAECPMCGLYTKAFISSKMLEKDGRVAYQEYFTGKCATLDRQRAANEIALINTNTGEVTYGIQSLFKVIANRFPIMKPIFSFAPFAWFMSKIYAFISFNRKIIIPAAAIKNSIQPAFKLHYRLFYLAFSWCVTAFILTNYARHLTEFVPIGSAYREYLICGAQILFQGMVLLFLKKEMIWAYLGNMMTISLAGALAFLPILFLAQFIEVPALLFLSYFFTIAGLMFLEHIRRSKLLGLGWLPTVSWFIYRLIVLGLILIFEL
ncbi:DUF393 domain-containing protein [Pedobacter sp. AW1-32]|uniref:DUF393 domain-containing protein n=1 Tax=Pedobacter sp. AW1-32 TaxID=3383026 RepID=UPI003FF08012